MTVAQILAVSIFVVMFVLMVLDKIEKQYITLVAGALTLILVFGVAMHSMDAVIETLNVKNIFTKGFWITSGEGSEESSGINWATIIFLAGMMVMVEGMAKAGFFRWLCLRLAKLVHYKPIPLFVTFMVMAAVLSMFIDSITVILFLAAVTIELAKLLHLDPVPMILSEVFCANLGGSATMCGDPPNIIIGTVLKISPHSPLISSVRTDFTPCRRARAAPPSFLTAAVTSAPKPFSISVRAVPILPIPTMRIFSPLRVTGSSLRAIMTAPSAVGTAFFRQTSSRER